MTAHDDPGRVVSDWLHEYGAHRVPNHLDAVLRTTSTRRQRPAWSSLERWLPMDIPTRAQTFAPPRLGRVLLVALLVLALAAAALAVVGSRQQRLPAPFGPARNGAVLYGGTDGDIHVLDPVTGASRVLVPGAAADHVPAFSPDGTRFLFLRDTTVTDPVFGGPEPMVMVANADGSDVRALTGALERFGLAAWSHDGATVAVAADLDAGPSLQLYAVDGRSQPVTIDTQGMTALYAAFRPGDRELTFRGSTPDGDGLYVVGVDGNGLRTIVPPGQGDGASLSPDGTKLAYQVWDGTVGTIHVVDVDSGTDSIPAIDPPASATQVDDMPVWSPDGTRLLFVTYAVGRDNRLAIAPASGGPRVEIGPAMPNAAEAVYARFSPDGTSVLVYYAADQSTWLLDPSGLLADRRLESTISDRSTWQRLAP